MTSCLISLFVLSKNIIQMFLKNVDLKSRKNSTNMYSFKSYLLCSQDVVNGIKWVGNGTEYSKDPKLLMEKAKINLTRSFESILWL